MAEFPAMPFSTDKYLADTTHLTTTEHGAYLLLLIAMWRNGGWLPNDPKLLARYAKLSSAQWGRMTPVMMPFFTVEGDRLCQGRLTDTLAAVRQRSRVQSDNARAKSRKSKEPRPATASPNASHGTPYEIEIEIEKERKKDNKPAPSQTATRDFVGKAGRGYEDVRSALLGLPGVSGHPIAATASIHEIWQLLEAGVSLETVILPKISDMVAKAKGPIKSWSYFVQAITETIKPTAASVPNADDATWRKRLEIARERKQWDVRKWGAMPHQAGCRVPVELLQPSDGQGWTEWKAAA